MHLRDALITQAPSLALQRAAASEVARLDSLVLTLLRGTVAAANLLDSVAHVATPGDTAEPLRLLRAACLEAVS